MHKCKCKFVPVLSMKSLFSVSENETLNLHFASKVNVPWFKDVSTGKQNKTKTLKIFFFCSAVHATLNAMTMNVRFSALM